MTAPVSLTRVRPPQRRKESLRRLRLLETLHRNIQRKLTFISAPAGYGKTALLIDFASDVDALVCWYSVAPEHGDLVSFARHLITAFQQKFPEFGTQIRLDQQTSAHDATGLAVAISNEMVNHITDFCLMMIDDFHLVGEAQLIVNFIEALIDHLPDHVRFHIASRNVYGVPTITLVTDQEMTLIGQKELRFRADEIQALVKQNQRINLPYEQASYLAEVADGWILALQLGARSLQTGAPLKLEGAMDDIYAFLLQEVLDPLSPQLRTLMLATSVVDEFDDALCNHLMGATSSAEQLHRLPERNLFVTEVETANGISYQYHQLFCDFLRTQLWLADPDWARSLHYRAAQWFEGREQWDLAVRHYLAANQYAAAAQVMEHRALPIYISGQTQLISKWVEAIAKQPTLINEAPRLALARAKTLIDQGQLDESVERLLDIAEAGLRRAGDNEQLANALITRGMLYRFRSAYNEALQLAQQAENLLEERKGFRWLQAHRLRGICMGQMGKREEGARALETAATGFRKLEQRHDLAETLNDLAVVYFEMGDIYRVQISMTESLQIRRQTGGDRLCNALGNIGFLYHLTGRYREAWQAYDEALKIAETAKYLRTITTTLHSQATLLCDIEEWVLARTAYEKSRHLAETNGDNEGLASASEGLMTLERLLGNYTQALHWLREAARCRKESDESPNYQLGLGLIYFNMGQQDLAEHALTLAIEKWRVAPRPSEGLAVAEFALAQSALARKKRKRALEYLQQSLSHAAQLGYDQFLVIAARHANGLLKSNFASELISGQKHWLSIVEKAENFQTGLISLEDRPEVATSSDQTRIELFAFGAGQVWRNGEPIAASHWASARSRALFCYLCTQKRATRDMIALEFWPDFSQAQVSSNFHATLWRVRHAVGQDIIAREGDTYSISASVSYWCDADEFDSLMQRANTRAISDEERANHWRQAVELYKGPYLENIDMGWVSDRRHAYQQANFAALVGLGKWELGRRRYEVAREWYEKAASEDNLDGEAAFGLLSCLVQLGSIPEARAFYASYKKRLADELGEEPPLQLKQLHESFR